MRSVCAALIVLACSTTAHAAAGAPRPAATTPASTGVPASTPTPKATTSARETSSKGAWRRPPVPPRIDGAYLGMAIYGTASLARVNKIDAEGSPFAGFGGHARVGQMVLPWLGFGLMVGGALGVRSERSNEGTRQRLGLGELMVDTTFVPIPKIAWSLRAGFGFGGGAVRQAGVSARAGFGGAMFSLATRYEWFPFANRFRPNRGGGFGVGPELGWLGATPSAKGRPMAHVMYLGLSTTIYFGT